MPARRTAPLRRALAALYPDLDSPDDAIRAGRVQVDGRIVTNPASVVGPGSSVVLCEPARLRGEAKLEAALQAFQPRVTGSIALDVGAAAGGFTRVLLAHGAQRVYAVDAGHGQLLGSLRQDPRVVNLEATNLAQLDRRLVPDPIELFTLDLSYLSLADAVPQLVPLLADTADLIALVKPMFELHLPAPPQSPQALQEARHLAVSGIERAGWRVLGSIDSPVRGSRGAREFLVHARRSAPLHTVPDLST